MVCNKIGLNEKYGSPFFGQVQNDFSLQRTLSAEEVIQHVTALYVRSKSNCVAYFNCLKLGTYITREGTIFIPTYFVIALKRVKINVYLSFLLLVFLLRWSFGVYTHIFLRINRVNIIVVATTFLLLYGSGV